MLTRDGSEGKYALLYRKIVLRGGHVRNRGFLRSEFTSDVKVSNNGNISNFIHKK